MPRVRLSSGSRVALLSQFQSSRSVPGSSRRRQSSSSRPTGVPTFAVREPVLRIKPGAIVETRTFSKPGDYYERPAARGPARSVRSTSKARRPTTRSSSRSCGCGRIATRRCRRSIRTASAPSPATRARACSTIRCRRAASSGSSIARATSASSICRTRRPSGSRCRSSRCSAASRWRRPARKRSAACGPATSAATWTPPTRARARPSTCRSSTTARYFYFGDGHALQGDGEIVGSGLETTMDVTFQFDLIKGRRIRWPRMEDADDIMVAGSVRPLVDAFRIAQVELIEWLVDDYGFDKHGGLPGRVAGRPLAHRQRRRSELHRHGEVPEEAAAAEALSDRSPATSRARNSLAETAGS